MSGLEPLVSLANIGAFFLQAFSLPLLVKRTRKDTRSLLREARAELNTTMSIMWKYRFIIEYTELGALHTRYTELNDIVNANLAQPTANFLSNARAYKQARAAAKERLLDSEALKMHAALASAQAQGKSVASIVAARRAAAQARPPLDTVDAQATPQSVDNSCDPSIVGLHTGNPFADQAAGNQQLSTQEQERIVLEALGSRASDVAREGTLET
ncbi:hypothetical protein Hypma_007476 [Hypsizygus marmoreus]|uniref:Uncharacterized protein n=1 Tax=Hypsizygus marmoreus TaxID=39966 RepID=A0A369K007_HYPMA|nr:hypothetical protein Hypma_007476 [Hypsizygus marmoreus]